MKPQCSRVVLTVFLLIVCYAISAHESAIHACNFPPLQPWNYLAGSTYPNDFHVSVYIDTAFEEPDRANLALGLTNWELWSAADCSGWTIDSIDTMDMSGIDLTDIPPPHTVWIIKQPTTFGNIADGTLTKTGDVWPFQRVVGQKIRINPNSDFVGARQYNWFTFFVAHEAGHAFGLGEMAGTGGGADSVMAGAHNDVAFNSTVPTICDVLEVGIYYCCTETSCPEDFTWDPTMCSCQPDTSTQGGCETYGWYWNFENNDCQSTPATEAQCNGIGWYWDFAGHRCGSSPAVGMCAGGPDWGNYPSGCYGGLSLLGGICGRSTTFINHCYGGIDGYDFDHCVCFGCDTCGGSPILVDVPGGFDLTDVNHGVKFDLNGNGTLDRLSWTSSTSTAKWLVFDRNRNGTIDNGKELFGNFTFQTEPPAGVEKNGFLALAEYDKPENGGNGDGMIDSRDAVFSKLRLWQDVNHNGISESNELHLLSDFDIEAISLDYKESRRHDRFGNQFRYRAKLYGPKHRELSHWAWDVFLLSAK